MRLPALKSVLRAIPSLLWGAAKALPRLIVDSLRLVKLCLTILALSLACVYAVVQLAPQQTISSHQIKKNLPPLEPSAVYSPQDSLVRILRVQKDGTKQFYCTGFVIGSNYVLTAAHCLVDEDGTRTNDEIIIENPASGLSQHAKAVGINTRMDWGLITGNFMGMPAAKVAETEFDVPKVVAACGYPQGSHTPHCEGISPDSNDAFLVHGVGILFPGMSGGPVFDIKTGAVIGINVQVGSSVAPTGAAYTPTIGVLACFGIAD